MPARSQPPLKCFWITLILTTGSSLTGWFLWQEHRPLDALSAIVIPGSLLLGAAFTVTLFRREGGLIFYPMLLVVIQAWMCGAPRIRPRSSLFHRAMTEFLGEEVTVVEAFVGSFFLLGLMFLTALAAALLTAEALRLATGREDLRGRALFKPVLKRFQDWEQLLGRSDKEPKP